MRAVATIDTYQAVYKEHLELMEIALDVDKLSQGLNRVRKGEA